MYIDSCFSDAWICDTAGVQGWYETGFQAVLIYIIYVIMPLIAANLDVKVIISNFYESSPDHTTVNTTQGYRRLVRSGHSV